MAADESSWSNMTDEELMERLRRAVAPEATTDWPEFAADWLRSRPPHAAPPLGEGPLAPTPPDAVVRETLSAVWLVLLLAAAWAALLLVGTIGYRIVFG